VSHTRLAVLVAPVIGILFLPGALLAGDGRIEINEATVLASGGYPYVISSRGSYVLTGDLNPPADVIGIQVDADDVNIDLNGFAIRGNLVCVPNSCTGTGPSAAISVPASPLTNGRRCSVRNGSITGVGTAVVLRDEALVDALSVSNTSSHAIVLGPRSLATRNRITAVGRSALSLGAGSGYGQNVIASTGQFLAFGSVLGGRSIGGNVCDDGRCPNVQRYYMTSAFSLGNQAQSACEAGFHMASVLDLQHASALSYDATRGIASTFGDQLPGPPTSVPGWARSGTSSFATGAAGVANCNGWQSAGSSDQGTVAALSFGAVALTLGNCGAGAHVWCIEDP